MSKAGSTLQRAVKDDFETNVLEPEAEAIRQRRRKHGLPDNAEDILGVSLSGGGIRSASFGLGVLQALDAYGLANRIDYLSTVSGGGYIGGSLVKAMSESKGEFPFATELPNKYSDSLDVMHLRNYSKFLIPNGLIDFYLSLGVVLRGLATNVITVFAFLFFFAAVTLATNPTREHLSHSFIYDLLLKLPYTGDGVVMGALLAWSYSRFAVTNLLLVAGALLLIVWAIRKSRPKDVVLPKDIDSGMAFLVKRFLVLFSIVFALELNTWVVDWLISVYEKTTLDFASASKYYALLAGYAATAAAFREKLLGLISNGLGVNTKSGALKAFIAAAMLFVAGLILPILIYLFYVLVVYRGMGLPVASAPATMSDVGWFVFHVQPGLVSAIVLAFLAVMTVLYVSALLAQQAKGEDKLSGVFPLLLFLLSLLNFTDGSFVACFSDVSRLYLELAIILMALMLNFSANSNSLHGLYRDRLRKAFLTRPNMAQRRTFFSDLDCEHAPYLLMNCSLNARVISKRYQESEEFKEIQNRAIFTDPARRGRNAEFFFFSPKTFGSTATGFLRSEKLRDKEYNIDMASAMAISGAAASSSMGKSSFGILTATLALLNIRLGYWLKNPLWDDEATVSAGNVKVAFLDRIGFYLFTEIFGQLRTDSPKIYLTDGAHSENLGLYQLVKRRCPYIIVVDAEADPQYTFAALADLQRYARIDLGVRMDVDWKHIRSLALGADKDGAQGPSSNVDPKFGHFAVGKVFYPEEAGKPAFEGTLLYLKTAVTGDEPDYVLDYKRRYPAFPQETTADQFFSEDQMEAYRALGFHTVQMAFCEREVGVEGMIPGQLAIWDMKTKLGIPGKELG